MAKILPSSIFIIKKPPKLNTIVTEMIELVIRINIKWLQGLFELWILQIGKDLDININI